MMIIPGTLKAIWQFLSGYDKNPHIKKLASEAN